jgi:hypothetical protein
MRFRHLSRCKLADLIRAKQRSLGRRLDEGQLEIVGVFRTATNAAYLGVRVKGCPPWRSVNVRCHEIRSGVGYTTQVVMRTAEPFDWTRYEPDHCEGDNMPAYRRLAAWARRKAEAHGERT